jgi:hypothetical protein
MMTRLSIVVLVVGPALGLAACNCNGNPVAVGDAGSEGVGSCATACQTGYYCCGKTQTCERVKYNCVNVQTCAPGTELAFPDPPYMNEATCEPLPLQCTCKEGDALKPGMIGRFSAVAASGGTLYASGYEVDFGDLVLLTAKTGALDTITREIVDGVPQSPPSKAPSGWRGGVTEAGDDVGQDTDIAIGGGGEPIIAYRDLTNRSLKLAVRAGGTWKIHTVESPKGKETIGRYAALLLDGGKPAIAYLVLGLAGTGGAFTSELRWAAASSATPSSASDWTVSVIESKAMACQNLCATTEACVLKTDGSSSCQTKGTGCTPACTGDTACVGGSCKAILPDAKYVDLPRASGLWPAPVSTSAGVVVVYHDRTAGRLRAAKRAAAGSWTATTILSPAAGEEVGAFPSVAAGSTGNIHVSFQNATKLSLHYLQLDPATMTLSGSVETIDDGVRPDGPHPVGADSAIALDASGVPRVVYQDARTVDLLQAKRSGAGSWTPSVPTDANLGRALKTGAKGYGFYNDLVVEAGQVYGSSFFYDVANNPKGDLVFFVLP